MRDKAGSVADPSATYPQRRRNVPVTSLRNANSSATVPQRRTPCHCWNVAALRIKRRFLGAARRGLISECTEICHPFLPLPRESGRGWGGNFFNFRRERPVPGVTCRSTHSRTYIVAVTAMRTSGQIQSSGLSVSRSDMETCKAVVLLCRSYV